MRGIANIVALQGIRGNAVAFVIHRIAGKCFDTRAFADVARGDGVAVRARHRGGFGFGSAQVKALQGIRGNTAAARSTLEAVECLRRRAALGDPARGDGAAGTSDDIRSKVRGRFWGKEYAWLLAYTLEAVKIGFALRPGSGAFLASLTVSRASLIRRAELAAIAVISSALDVAGVVWGSGWLVSRWNIDRHGIVADTVHAVKTILAWDSSTRLAHASLVKAVTIAE